MFLIIKLKFIPFQIKKCMTKVFLGRLIPSYSSYNKTFIQSESIVKQHCLLQLTKSGIAHKVSTECM